MKRWLFIALAAALANAQSPSPQSPSHWWQAYASPDATALVGIEWNHLRHTPLADAIEARISSSGTLALPDLDCLREAREIVISSPGLLAMISGSFLPKTVQDQAERQGLRAALYRGVKLFLPVPGLPPQASPLGIAQITDRVLLVGAQRTLQTAIDRQLDEAARPETARPESALLNRASSQTGDLQTRDLQTRDLWIAAARLPDPLASLFMLPALFPPIDAGASAFAGRVTVHDGFSIEASFDAGSPSAATEFVTGLRNRRGLDATAHQSRVAFAWNMTSEALLTALQPARLPLDHMPLAKADRPASPPEPQPTPALAAAAPVIADPDPGPSFKFEVTHFEALQPRIIRIFNLEEGTREIVLPVPH